MKGFKLIFNVNEEAGQVIFHTHMHFIPYYSSKKENEMGNITSDQIQLIRKELKRELN